MALPLPAMASISATRGDGRLQVEVGDGDLGACTGEREGDFLADAAGSTGDDGNFIVETHFYPCGV
jgi:hypothetical protein